jgi:CDGSH-type Zn-finger protein/truncated hemoglobin YjbI
MTESTQPQEEQKALPGRLARVIATRGGLAPPEAPFVIEHREALIYMLCEAAELEHGIMCQYLFAAFSLKEDPAEGLTEDQAAMARRWRKQISHVAGQEMLHLALVQNLLSAIGAAPHVSRPNFPQPASHYPAGVHLTLLPFGEAALRHFMYLERPEGMALHDAPGLAAYSRAAPAMQPGDIAPHGQDFATVGHLYRSIEAGIEHLAQKYGERWLFVGPPRSQATQQYFGWPELVAVTDVASARRAIGEILEQGEGPRGDWRDAHFGQFVAILDEFEQQREADRGFDPVRPVLALNVRPSERDPNVPLVTDPLAQRVMDLFNVCYEILLLMLQRFFAHTEETEAQLKALADGTYALMVQAIKPLGDVITRLPAGPEYPGQTAGPSFELFYESDYVLPHREAAWVLLTERIEVAAEFCGQSGADCGPEVAEKLAEVRGALAGIARSLAEHLPARLAPATAGAAAAGAAAAGAPAEEVPAMLARARDFYRSCVTGSHDDAVSSALTDVARAAYRVLEHLGGSDAAAAEAVTVARITDSVLRPLADRLGRRPAADQGPAADAPEIPEPRVPDGTVPELARRAAADATRLCAQLAEAAPPELLEAVAALQRVAVDLAPDAAAQVAELTQLQRGLRPRIVVAENGPYLVTNAAAVRSHLGDPLRVAPQLALCRCGESGDKPFCDGSHARTGFSGAKDRERVPDRRDTYPGAQVTIFDNRGICQHSGFCTDRLSAVFRTDAEPFVAPNGGRMDEIIRAVRECPSGALSLEIDGIEARDLAEWHGVRERAIEVSLDGPYRVTGGMPLVDAAGEDVSRAAGSSPEHFALCRCGQSQNKPFCSGMHWYVQFRDPAAPADPTLFEWAGGLPALTRMTRMLYESLLPADDLLAPAFADLPPGAPQREAAWLAEVFGGPQTDGATALANQDLTPAQRERWAALALRAADRAGLPEDLAFRAALAGFLNWASQSPTGPAAEVPSWDWGPAGPPDTSEEHAGASEQNVVLPGPEETVGFEAHIRPLFRDRDRTSMLFAFDLASFDDVRQHAAEILERLRNGTMPCDGAWPQSWTEVFARWAESGFQP